MAKAKIENTLRYQFVYWIKNPMDMFSKDLELCLKLKTLQN